jgi:hypothetical protein
MVSSRVELATHNHGAGEGQLQFSRLSVFKGQMKGDKMVTKNRELRIAQKLMEPDVLAQKSGH